MPCSQTPGAPAGTALYIPADFVFHVYEHVDLSNMHYFGAQSLSLHPGSAQLRTLLMEFARGLPYWPAGLALPKWAFSGPAEITPWVTISNFFPIMPESQRLGLRWARA